MGRSSLLGLLTIFVCALCQPANAASSVRVSVDSAGNQAYGDSGAASISADGRFVAFRSVAANLVSGDTNGQSDVFVHDRQTHTTARVSVRSNGAQATGGGSYAPSISGNGRFVAFASEASNLVSGDTNGVQDIFVHDRQTGSTELVSFDTDGSQLDGESSSPSISSDGRFVAFSSNNGYTVFVRDRQTGTTELLVDGSVVAGGNYYRSPSISADGRFVAIDTGFKNYSWILVYDRQTHSTETVPRPRAADYAYSPAISADGRFVAYRWAGGGGAGLNVYD